MLADLLVAVGTERLWQVQGLLAWLLAAVLWLDVVRQERRRRARREAAEAEESVRVFRSMRS